MALQRLGAVDMQALLREMRVWANGNDYEQRAAAAALCEPALLRNLRDVDTVLDPGSDHLGPRPVNRIAVPRVSGRSGRLAYCWSVAVAASPDRGRELMQPWVRSDDPDVRWIMKQNLEKKRIAAAGADWVASRLNELRDPAR